MGYKTGRGFLQQKEKGSFINISITVVTRTLYILRKDNAFCNMLITTSLMISQNKTKYEIKLLYKAGSSPAINWRSIQVDKSSTTNPPITLHVKRDKRKKRIQHNNKILKFSVLQMFIIIYQHWRLWKYRKINRTEILL